MKKKLNFIFICLIQLLFSSHGKDIYLKFQPPPGMFRADLYILSYEKKPRSVIVLCPGVNGNGSFYLREKEWKEFAIQNKIALAAISFASDLNDIHSNRGYYCSSERSGSLLTDALDEIFYPNIPILIYGFSGGAHFTADFVEYKPQRVLAWCAYSAAWWNKPKCNMPPGIVACGEWDFRRDASLNYFWDGREKRNPWLWIQIKNKAHSRSLELECFVRAYFTCILTRVC